MAQTITARIGDTVRANFNLVFKNAEVNKLPDKDSFFDYGFMMECTRPSPPERISDSFPSGKRDGQVRSKPASPVGDDQPVEVDFVFESIEKFRVNDLWKLSLVYVGNPANFPGGDEPHPRKHLLGLVQLVA